MKVKPSVKKTMAEPIENYNEKIHRAIEMFRQVSPKSNCTVTTKLEDLRKVFTKDRDQNLRIKSVEKQKAKKIQINRDVPACLHKYLDDGNIESFQVLKENHAQHTTMKQQEPHRQLPDQKHP